MDQIPQNRWRQGNAAKGNRGKQGYRNRAFGANQPETFLHLDEWLKDNRQRLNILLEALKDNPKSNVRELNLAASHITIKGALAIKKFLLENITSKIERIDLRYNTKLPLTIRNELDELFEEIKNTHFQVSAFLYASYLVSYSRIEYKIGKLDVTFIFGSNFSGNKSWSRKCSGSVGLVSIFIGTPLLWFLNATGVEPFYPLPTQQQFWSIVAAAILG